MPDALVLAGVLLVLAPLVGMVPVAYPPLFPVWSATREGTSRSSAPIVGRGACSTSGSASRRSGRPPAWRRSLSRWEEILPWRGP